MLRERKRANPQSLVRSISFRWCRPRLLAVRNLVGFKLYLFNDELECLTRDGRVRFASEVPRIFLLSAANHRREMLEGLISLNFHRGMYRRERQVLFCTADVR